MNLPSKEKIRRQIYKSEEIKKKKEELEKLKYPALNGLVNEDNVLDYFICGDEENDNNFINDSNIQIEYEICSYFNNEEVPDLYTPFGIISGNKYKIVPYEEENQVKSDIGIDLLMDNNVKNEKKNIKK